MMGVAKRQQFRTKNQMKWRKVPVSGRAVKQLSRVVNRNRPSARAKSKGIGSQAWSRGQVLLHKTFDPGPYLGFGDIAQTLRRGEAAIVGAGFVRAGLPLNPFRGR